MKQEMAQEQDLQMEQCLEELISLNVSLKQAEPEPAQKEIRKNEVLKIFHDFLTCSELSDSNIDILRSLSRAIAFFCDDQAFLNHNYLLMTEADLDESLYCRDYHISGIEHCLSLLLEEVLM